MFRVGLNGYIEGEKKVMSSTSAIRRLFYLSKRLRWQIQRWRSSATLC